METEWCKVGDLVSLKSYGPRMTVVYVEQGVRGAVVMCQWFDRAGNLKSGSFPADSVEPAPFEEKKDE